MTTTETPTVEQPEMPGMPPVEVVPNFLHICEIGANEFGITVAMLNILRNLPGADDGDKEMFGKAAEKAARYVREQIGRRAFNEAFNVGYDRLTKVMTKAKAQTAKEGHPE